MTVHNVFGKTVGVVAFIVFGLALFGVLFKGAGGGLGISDPYTVRVTMPDAFQLVDNADVRRAGVKIGRVRGITNRGSQAVVQVEIFDKYAPVYRDATSLLRTKTLVGENYIQLDPGHPRAGRLQKNGIIPAARAGEPVQLDEILSSLDSRTRDRIKANLDGLGGGVAGRARDLTRLFAATRPTILDGATVMGIADRQRDAFAGLVQDTGRVTKALAARSGELQNLVVSAKATAEAVAARDKKLGQTFEELPSTLRQVRSSIRRLRDFAVTATPVVGNLQRGFEGLRPVVEQLPDAAIETRRTFSAMRPFLTVADPMLARLAPFARALTTTVPALDAFLRQTQPMVSFLKPYDREFGSFLAANGAALSYRDAMGGAVRIFNHIDQQSYSAFTPEIQAAVKRLSDAGAVVLGDFPRKQSNPYPAPGAVGNPQAFDGNVPRVEARP